jgi:hypothetical protein
VLAAGVIVRPHLRVTSTTGQVFVQDLPFTVDFGGVCPRLSPSMVNVIAVFGDAGVSDGAFSDAPEGG